jgi:hypothetical protein
LNKIFSSDCLIWIWIYYLQRTNHSSSGSGPYSASSRHTCWGNHVFDAQIFYFCYLVWLPFNRLLNPCVSFRGRHTANGSATCIYNLRHFSIIYCLRGFESSSPSFYTLDTLPVYLSFLILLLSFSLSTLRSLQLQSLKCHFVPHWITPLPIPVIFVKHTIVRMGVIRECTMEESRQRATWSPNQ